MIGTALQRDSQKRLSSLTIFFPAYHDEHTIEPLTRKAIDVARTLTNDFEIIIVDDQSPDRVGEIADRLAREFPEVRAIHHEKNMGVSHAMTTGYRAAAKDWVFYTDGDAQYDIEELPLLVEHADQFEIIAGYRLNRAEGLVRAFASRGFHMLVLLFFGYHFKDIDCSFKLIHRNFLKRITFYTGGGLLDTEIMVQARMLRVPIKDVGVHHFEREFGTSQFLKFSLVRRMFLDLVKLRFKLR